MEIEFKNKHLDRIETDSGYEHGYPSEIVKAYRKRMQLMRQSVDERDFVLFGVGNFEKLKGNRQHQYSMRLNDQWRLILEFKGRGSQKIVVIVDIEDYH